ncbi:hypothetical protein JR316_0012886 [Psilocybe cubensis]|uniref:Uncharacterized protein n=2 Tax=Psilocybe cubensis TaxID=181762 RepID=A0A8H7XU45_PSICU|nr:hypothetical protein JR316_0012886 [Psilocybe cubensis]KAH9474427.1 hypothetical protein JR316_0012886 [Psilocybe cubensis]
MIVVTPDIESDAASTHTLVTPPKYQETPHHLPRIIYSSLLISTLAFVFAIVNYVTYYHYYDVPAGIVAPILAYVSTVPHHCAVILLNWLERHQSESIFPFAPASLRGILYSLVPISLWAASTTVSAINLHRDSASWSSCTYKPIQNANGTYSVFVDCDNIITYHPTIAHDYWCSFTSTLTSALELLLALIITSICFMHYRRRQKAVLPNNEPSSSPSSTPSESKVVSA